MAEPLVAMLARNTSPGPNPVRRVVIHSTSPSLPYPRAAAAGMAASTARYFQSARAGGSAHYVCDIAGEAHCVPESVVAWHAPPNTGSIGIEICSDVTYSTAQWLSPSVWPAVARAAARAADVCARHGVPAEKLSVAAVRAGERGICGHWDVSRAFGKSTHTDPGASFPWAEFMDAVRGGSRPGPGAVSTPLAAQPLPTLRRGEASGEVRALQRFLTRMYPSYARFDPTGFYGPQTVLAVAEFQRRSGITGPDADGATVGPRTNAALWAAGYRGK